MEKQKLIYVESKAQFSPSSVSNKAIVFIKDTKEIWTHGTYFICSNVWATPITLTLSGDSTGSVSIDGSGNVTLQVENKYLTGIRDYSLNPNDAVVNTNWKIAYYVNVLAGSTNLFPAVNNANAILTLNTHDYTFNHQLGFSSNGCIYHRIRTAGNWETSWREILTSTNYTKYPHTFASLTNKPTTISGYGITDSIPIIKGGEVKGDTDLSTLGMTTTGYKFSISWGYESYPSWLMAYTNVLMFRGSSDSYGAIGIEMMGDHRVQFMGGRNAETTKNNVPNWWFRIKGSSSATYDLNSFQNTINNLNSNYLRKSGGTMTGILTLTTDTAYINDTQSGSAIFGTVSTSNTFTGISGLETIFAGRLTNMVLRTSGDNLYHYNHSKSARYKILDANNYTTYALPLTGGTLTDTLILKAGAFTASNSNSYSGGRYQAVSKPNIRLIGDSTYGLSTIEFTSQKGDTSINKPSDSGFIQFQPYGVSALSSVGSHPTLKTSGETNALVLGVTNDSDDIIVLQSPNVSGLRHTCGATEYYLPHVTTSITSINRPLLSTTTAHVYQIGPSALGDAAYQPLSKFVYATSDTYYSYGTTEASGKSSTLNRTQFWRDNNRAMIGVYVQHSINANYGFELASSYDADSLEYRRKWNGTWETTQKILTNTNYSTYALPLSGGTLTGTLTSSSITPRTSVTYNIGTTSAYYNNIYAQYFKRKDSSDSYVLLGGGGHKLLSDFALTSSLNNYVTLSTDQTVSGKKQFSNQLIIRKDVGDTDSKVIDIQHDLQLQVRRDSNTHSVAIGVMPTGAGVIWAKANGIGYNTLYLNPYNNGVAIGCGNGALPNLKDGYYFHIFGSTLSNNSITATKFIKSGGTSSQFLKADGSLDSTSYLKTDGSNGTSAGVSTLLNKLTTGTGNPQDTDYYICQYAGGSTATTTYHRRPTSALYNYIRAKLYNSTSNYFIMGNGDLLSKEDVYSIGSYTAVKNSYYTGNAMYYYWYKIEFPESSSGSASATYSIMINDDNNYPRFSHYILNIKRYYTNNIYGNSYQLTHLGGTSQNIMLWIANDSTPNLYIQCPCAYGEYGLRIKCIYGTNKFNPTPVEYNNGGVASSFTIINKYLDQCSVRVNSTGVVTHTYGNIIKTDIVGNVTGTSSGNLTDISYDSTNRILKQTKNRTTTNVVTFGTNAFSSSKYAGSSSDGGAATSANKLNTNAGNSTTPVYFSNGVPVACTAYSSASVNKANLLACPDKRNNYPAQIVTAGGNIGAAFIHKSMLGGAEGIWYDAIVLRGYVDDSGGNENALLFSKNSSSVYHSQYAFGSTTTWGTLYKFLDSGNYKNYAPSLSGEGATGTWGINISGTANKVANALTLQLNGGTTSGTNKFVYDGTAAYTVNITPASIGAAASSHSHDYLPLSGGTISSSSYGPLVIERSGSSTLMAAIKFKNASGDLGSIGIGSVNGDLLIYNAGISAYRTILDSGNSSISENTTNKTCTIKINGTSKTVSSSTHNHDSSYLKLSGGTLGSSSASVTELRTQSSTAALRIMSYSDSTNYIQSGNSSFDGNTTLRITGYSNTTGTNLHFKFNNIYCRDNDYINIDSGNYGSYALPLSGGTMIGALNTANIYPKSHAGFNIGSTSSYYNTMYAYYFKKYGSDDNYLLLGGGGHKRVSDFLQIQNKGIEGGSGGNTDNWVLVLNNNYSTGWYGPCTMFYIRSKNFGCGILCFYHYWNTEGTSGYYDNSVWFFGAEHSAYSVTMGGTGRDINNYLKVYIDKENADLKIYYNRYNNQPLNVQELQFVHGPSGTLYPSGELRASHFINSTQAVELPTTSNTFVNIPIQTTKNHTEDIKTTRSVYASAFYENSDIRLKENVHSIDQIDLLKNVDLVQFNFKNDQNKKYGVIAQQLEQVGLNNLVYEHNGNKAVDYISLLVLETQRLRNEIKELKEKLDKKELSS